MDKELIEKCLPKPDQISIAFRGYNLHASMVTKEGIVRTILEYAIPIISAEAKEQVAYELFEEMICPMCYRLNPQHATMDYGKGCHYCQDREDWQALKDGE